MPSRSEVRAASQARSGGSTSSSLRGVPSGLLPVVDDAAAVADDRPSPSRRARAIVTSVPVPMLTSDGAS